MKITGNTIVITGGGSGIGQGLAEALHQRGNKVIIAGRRKDALDRVVAANKGMSALTLDLQSPESINEFAGKLARDFPSANVLINNSGIMQIEKISDAPVDLSSAEAMIETNLLGTIRLTMAMLSQLKKQPRATIMMVTSGLAFVPMSITPTYCATKAAIHSYTQSLRFVLRKSNVEVLELIPPYVQTELMGAHQASDSRAMPLNEFIAEVMGILETQPNATEICVERVKPLRFAEKNGQFESMFLGLNQMISESGPT